MLNRCLWYQVTNRTAKLYKVYPGGRVIEYDIHVPWTKGFPVLRMEMAA